MSQTVSLQALMLKIPVSNLVPQTGPNNRSMSFLLLKMAVSKTKFKHECGEIMQSSLVSEDLLSLMAALLHCQRLNTPLCEAEIFLHYHIQSFSNISDPTSFFFCEEKDFRLWSILAEGNPLYLS